MFNLLPVLIALIMLLTASVMGQDSVYLRTNVSIDQSSVTSGKVMLSLLARVNGPEALGQTPVPLASSGLVTLDQVRAALEAAGVRSGRITLNGSTCKVALIDTSEPNAKAASASTATADPPAVELAAHATIKGAVVRALADDLNIPTSDIKVTFDPRDQSLLATDVTALKVTVTPTGESVGGSARTITIRTYKDSSIHESQVIRVGVQVMRECVIAAQNIPRGAAVEPSATVELRWTDANIKVAASSDLQGALASTPIRAGKVITTGDLQPMLAAKKGQLLMVETVNGAMVLRIRAIATQDGRPGDEITVRTQPWNSSLRVRVNKAGNATALGPAPTLQKAPRPGKPGTLPRAET